jgi:hypothetical protein
MLPELWDDIVVLLVFAPSGISLEVDSSSSRERFLVPGPREILEEICNFYARFGDVLLTHSIGMPPTSIFKLHQRYICFRQQCCSGSSSAMTSITNWGETELLRNSLRIQRFCFCLESFQFFFRKDLQSVSSKKENVRTFDCCFSQFLRSRGTPGSNVFKSSWGLRRSL